MKRLSIALLCVLPMFLACGDDDPTTEMSAWIVSPLALDLAFGDFSVEVAFAGAAAQLELVADGVIVATQDAPTDAESVIFTWTSTASADGSVILSARAIANSGSTADSEGVEVIVDNTAPTATVDLARMEVVDGTVTIPTTINDAHPQTVKLLNRDGTITELSGTVDSFSLDTTTLNDGVHWICVEATDQAGHTTTSFEVPMLVLNNGEELDITYIPEALYTVPANYAVVEHHIRTTAPTEAGVTRLVSWLTWEGGATWNMELAIGEGICPHRGIAFTAVESTSGEVIIDLPRSELPADVVSRFPADERDSDTFPVNNDPATLGAFFAHVGLMNPQDHVNESMPIDVHFAVIK